MHVSSYYLLTICHWFLSSANFSINVEENNWNVREGNVCHWSTDFWGDMGMESTDIRSMLVPSRAYSWGHSRTIDNSDQVTIQRVRQRDDNICWNELTAQICGSQDHKVNKQSVATREF